MADAGGFEEAGGLAVDGDAHLVADGLDDEGVPLAGLELGGEGGAAAGDELARSAFFAGSLLIS